MDKDDKDDGQRAGTLRQGLALATSVTAGVGLGYMMIHSGVGEAMASSAIEAGRGMCEQGVQSAKQFLANTSDSLIKSFHRVSSAAPPTSLEAEVRGGLTLVDGAQTSKANGKKRARPSENKDAEDEARAEVEAAEEHERDDEMEAELAAVRAKYGSSSSHKTRRTASTEPRMHPQPNQPSRAMPPPRASALRAATVWNDNLARERLDPIASAMTAGDHDATSSANNVEPATPNASTSSPGEHVADSRGAAATLPPKPTAAVVPPTIDTSAELSGAAKTFERVREAWEATKQKAPREPHEVDLTDGWGLAWKPRKAATAAADDDNAPVIRGDIYLSTPSGATLRSLAEVKRYLGLLSPMGKDAETGASASVVTIKDRAQGDPAGLISAQIKVWWEFEDSDDKWCIGEVVEFRESPEHRRVYEHKILYKIDKQEVWHEIGVPEGNFKLVKEAHEKWRTDGSPYVGRTVERCFNRARSTAVVICWLPATGSDAALYKIRHEDEDVEDLELEELEAALAAYEASSRWIGHSDTEDEDEEYRAGGAKARTPSSSQDAPHAEEAPSTQDEPPSAPTPPSPPLPSSPPVAASTPLKKGDIKQHMLIEGLPVNTQKPGSLMWEVGTMRPPIMFVNDVLTISGDKTVYYTLLEFSPADNKYVRNEGVCFHVERIVTPTPPPWWHMAVDPTAYPGVDLEELKALTHPEVIQV